MSSEPSSRDVDRILSYLRERDERTADWRARVEAQLAELSKQVGEIDARVGRMDDRLEAVSHELRKLDEVVLGTPTAPGLTTRVDRIEQAVLLLRWFFGGGLVAAAAAIVVIWKFAAAIAHHT